MNKLKKNDAADLMKDMIETRLRSIIDNQQSKKKIQLKGQIISNIVTPKG